MMLGRVVGRSGGRIVGWVVGLFDGWLVGVGSIGTVGVGALETVGEVNGAVGAEQATKKASAITGTVRRNTVFISIPF